MGVRVVRSVLVATLALGLAAVTRPSVGQDPGDPPSMVARISYLAGDVSLQPSGEAQWTEAPANWPMTSGDRLYTAGGSRALVQMGGAELRLWQGTDMTLTNLSEEYGQIGLAQGSLRLHVYGIDAGSQIEVDTPNGAVLIESPGDYRVDVYPQDGMSVARVDRGNAQLTGPGINLPISGGYAVEMYGANPIQLQYVGMASPDELDGWSQSLDRRMANSISARYVSPMMVGYSDLDTYGSWSESEYGPAWFPGNVPQGWRPYSLGRWAYVEPWGYTWVDDQPWGFAPFHYGRWSVIGGRWGWVPGPPAVRPVYSPALVVFVGGGPGVSVGVKFGGGGGGIAAWFPIGVGEPYVPWYHCTPRYAQQVNVTNVNITNIHNTTIVKNYNTYITNVRVNNTVVNNTVVNNITYVNRTAVTAVPATAMAQGSSVARQQVRLSPQQQQQLATAPIAVRPPVAAPAVAHPSLMVKTAVAQPVARPVLVTPAGQARAVPAATRPHPVNVTRLPAATVLPKNAPPAPGAKMVPSVIARPMQPGTSVARPNEQAAPITKQAPAVSPARPVPQTAPVQRTPPPTQPRTDQNARPVPQTAPTTKQPPAPARPATVPPRPPAQTVPVKPTPSTQLVKPTPPTQGVKPAQTQPAKPPQKAEPAKKEPKPEPKPEEHPQ